MVPLGAQGVRWDYSGIMGFYLPRIPQSFFQAREGKTEVTSIIVGNMREVLVHPKPNALRSVNCLQVVWKRRN